jgi:hypothetical protein
MQVWTQSLWESLAHSLAHPVHQLTHCLCQCIAVCTQGEEARVVSSDQGVAFAREHGCLYKETSAKEDCGGVEEGVYDALVWGMVATILDTPGLVGRGSRRGNRQLDLGAGSSSGGRRGGCC